MRNSRRIICLLLAALFVALPFASVYADDMDVMDPATFGLNPDKPYDGTHLKFLICCSTAPQFASAAVKGEAEFTAMTGISVSWGDLPFGSFQEQLYLEATNPNTEFDIVAFVDAWGTNIYDFLHPLNDFVEEAGFDWDDYSPAYQGAATGLSDTIYGMPFRGHPLLLHYRADVLEAVGMDPPATWQDISAIGEAIQASGMDIAPIAMYYGLNVDQNLFNWFAQLWGAGTDIFDENWEPIFNNEAGVAATEQYISYVRDGYSPEASVAWNEQEANQELVQGRAAMFIGWWWMASRMINSEIPEVADNASFAPAPGWEGGVTTSYGYLWAVGILDQSDDRDAALEYLKWLTHPITERRIVLDASDPALDTNVAVRLSVLADPEVNEVHNGLQGVASAVLADARTIPLIPEYTEIVPFLAEAINELATDPMADTQAVLDRTAEDVRFVMQAAGYYDG
ncbi:MAG: extracellular solute-binding protein [Chloroflexi bacterium]|nr:extracellular solute-binding protein [Chloroflexota bacterium]